MSEPDPVELSRWELFAEYFLFHFRWAVVIPIVLPLSIVYELFTSLRNFIVLTARSAPKAHDRKVALIQDQVKKWGAGNRLSKMCTARSGWSTMSFRVPLYKDSMTKIQTNVLIDILEVDPIAMTVRVEPMVTMGQLTKYLIPLGYTLPIVPELDDLTIGGLINGCGVESSGRKYGLFQHICQSYEVVIANGDLIVATKDKDNKHQALFFGIPWSHGTLGLLVAATIRIIPAKPYVRLTYYPCQSKQKLLDRLEAAAKSTDNEFVEGLQFTHDTGVVMTGCFADSPLVNASINFIGKWYKPWFFEHVRGICTNNQEIVEYIPLRDYYHRHSRSIFWEIKDLVPFGNHPLFRYTLGWAMPPKISLLKRTTPKSVRNIYNRHHVLQDMLVPFEKASEAIELFHDEVAIYPIWLCPFNLPSSPGLIRQRTGTNIIYLDIGIYGNCELEKYHPVKTTRKLESFVRSVKGIQMLYADTYMTLPEFWEMFDGTLYDWLRIKYGCKDAFPNIYEKVNRAARY